MTGPAGQVPELHPTQALQWELFKEQQKIFWFVWDSNEVWTEQHEVALYERNWDQFPCWDLGVKHTLVLTLCFPDLSNTQLQ